MQSAMDAAESAISSQRQGPPSLRTRVTSASTGPACTRGAANWLLPLEAEEPAALTGRDTPTPENAGLQAGQEAMRNQSGNDPGGTVASASPRQTAPPVGSQSNTGSMPADVNADLRAAAQPLANSLSSGGLV